MISNPSEKRSGAAEHPTVWGLTPTEIHDRFWAARGVQVVRAGEVTEIVEDAELFLLMAPRLLTIFRLRPLLETLSWLKPDVLWVRLNDKRERGYREFAISDDDGQFVRFERDYGGADSRLARVALTTDRELAELWQQAEQPLHGWRKLRELVERNHRHTISTPGRTFDRADDRETAQFMHEIVQQWSRPDTVIQQLKPALRNAWCFEDAKIDRHCRFVGPAWVGAGRQLGADDVVVGPAILWDDPEARPKAAKVNWEEIEPAEAFGREKTTQLAASGWHGFAKRAFDLFFASSALAATLPLYPIVMAAIWLEDGRPFFFAHERETVGGRSFPCLKFRSMKKDAEEIKKQIEAENQVDGPQFFIEDDPRITRVGRFIRKYHIDELPQFLNVLMGHMSVVGPRPSPRQENQYCPAWREARLSVRPGVTGLWQISRTREPGRDFQEWIKYDVEYVERASLRLDVSIIWKTTCKFVRGR